MSNSKQNDDQRDEASRAHKQSKEGDEQHAAQSSTHASPATRLYRHALESILGMLTLGDLSRILSVSREWSAAVKSMSPISGSVDRDENPYKRWKKASDLPPIASIVGSPLMRHLVAIQMWPLIPMENAALGLLARHAPNLTSLCCDLILRPDEPLVLPAKLQSLQLHLTNEHTDAVVNSVLKTVAALPSLTRLRLMLSSFAHHSSIELSLLAACPSPS